MVEDIWWLISLAMCPKYRGSPWSCSLSLVLVTTLPWPFWSGCPASQASCLQFLDYLCTCDHHSWLVFTSGNCFLKFSWHGYCAFQALCLRQRPKYLCTPAYQPQLACTPKPCSYLPGNIGPTLVKFSLVCSNHTFSNEKPWPWRGDQGKKRRREKGEGEKKGKIFSIIVNNYIHFKKLKNYWLVIDINCTYLKCRIFLSFCLPPLVNIFIVTPSTFINYFCQTFNLLYSLSRNWTPADRKLIPGGFQELDIKIWSFGIGLVMFLVVSTVLSSLAVEVGC